MRTVTLVNPNTSQATTALMLDVARASAPKSWTIRGVTAQYGPALIVDAEGLAQAAHAVAALRDDIAGDGVIVAAFGDPGVADLRRAFDRPVVGIGEAAIRAAARDTGKGGGRRFSIVTTTPKLEASMRALVVALGFGEQLASIRVTADDPVALTRDERRLEIELKALVTRAITDDGAHAVVIGGGPLAGAARAIALDAGVSVIEPIPAAVACLARLIGDAE